MAVSNRQSKRTAVPRLAVIGCGAAARQFCFPGLAKFPGFRNSVIAVDKSATQAKSVANEFGLEHHCTDYACLPFAVDAAIVTTPHHLHAEQSIHFLQQGKPVFVEKPMGMSADEVGQMLEAASSGQTTLMVNNCRRLFPAYRRIAELLGSGELGAIRKISISDGSPLDWNSVSSFYLRNAKQSRGVFLDRGAHTVDVVCWWLSGRPDVIESRYDARGGAEALMNVQLMCGETPIQLVFSRLYKLENCYTIECEQARIKGRLYNSTRFEIERDGRTVSIKAGKPALYHDYALRLLDNFVNVVQGVASPLFTADDVATSIEVIDQAYRQARTFEMPWYENDPDLAFLRSQAPAKLT